MIGTITFTAICDIAWVEPFWIFAISLFFCGISLFLAPLCYNFTTFIALSLSFGFFASSLALTPIVTVTVYSKLLENSKLALVCCSDEWRGWVSGNRPNSESCTATSPYHPLELTGNFLVTVSLLSLSLQNLKTFQYHRLCNIPGPWILRISAV